MEQLAKFRLENGNESALSKFTRSRLVYNRPLALSVRTPNKQWSLIMAVAYRNLAADIDAQARRPSTASPFGLGLLLALSLLAAFVPARAEAADIEGSWRGGGTVSFGSGSSEKARCRVNYSRKSATSYGLSASCATASGKVEQTASLRKTGENSYSGSYHNKEYNTSGTINVVVRGNTQNVSLTSDNGARAALKLSR